MGELCAKGLHVFPLDKKHIRQGTVSEYLVIINTS